MDPEGDDPKVSDIAQAAACSTATIHNHFPNAVPDILGAITSEPVSYTHLTLPTILLV